MKEQTLNRRERKDGAEVAEKTFNLKLCLDLPGCVTTRQLMRRYLHACCRAPMKDEPFSLPRNDGELVVRNDDPSARRYLPDLKPCQPLPAEHRQAQRRARRPFLSLYRSTANRA